MGRAVGQNDLGDLVSLTGATLSRYESDKQEPDLGTIVRLAAALGVSPGWLAFGEAATLTTIVNGDPAKPLPRPLPRPDAGSPKKGRGTA